MTDIHVPEALWTTSLLPEGVLEAWRRQDGALVAAGDDVAEVRIEDALHELTAPRAGRLRILVAPNSVVEPGVAIGRIDPA